MDPNDWTPARGWAIALRKAGIRAIVIFAILTGVLYLAWPVVYESMALGSFLLITLFVVGSIIGGVLAHIVVRKVKEDSALSGWRLLVPMLVMVAATEVGACYLAAGLRGTSPAMMLVPFCGMVGWGLVTTFVKLIIM